MQQAHHIHLMRALKILGMLLLIVAEIAGTLYIIQRISCMHEGEERGER